jgi:hypothetical protein
MSAITHSVGDPIGVDLAEEIKVGTSRRGGRFDPRGTPAKVVIAIDDGAQQVGILYHDPPSARDVRVLERHLPARDRAMIAEFDDSAPLFGVRAHEFGNELGAIMGRQLCRERRLPGRLGAGENDANHAGASAFSERFHAT